MPKIAIRTHYDGIYAQSHYDSWTIRLSDGEGYEGYNNPAWDSDVITHEYMHAVIDTGYIHLDGDYMELAMDEAYCDYFSVAFKNDELCKTINTTGEYAHPPYERILDNNFVYPDDYIGDYHYRSQIFSGGLWDFRCDDSGNVDKDDIDELVLESLNNLVGSVDFLDGRDALIVAAEYFELMTYLYYIEYWFADHGIGDPPTDPPTVSIYGVTSMYTDESKQWTAYIEDGESPFTYQWKRKDFGSETWNEVGTSNKYTYPYPDTSFYLKLNIIDYYGRPDSTTITVTVSVRPLVVEIDGYYIPYAYFDETNYFWSVVSGGTPPYNTYAWSMRVEDSEEEDEWSDWESVGSDSIYNIYDWSYLWEDLFPGYNLDIGSNIQLKLVVTDNATESEEEIIDLEVTEANKKILSKPLPKNFKLEQNYPNPFNPLTTIKFQLPKASNVTLVIYNIQGQEVARLVDGYVGAGYHSIPWKPGRAASGIYIYRLKSRLSGFSDTKRMLYIK